MREERINFMSKKLFLTDSCADFAQGVAELTKELAFTLCEGGVPVEYHQGEGLKLEYDGSKAVITCKEKIHFFRMFTYLVDGMDKGAFTKEETANFDKAGGMFDCSRNAVLTVEGFEGFLRKMGMMGLNLAMLYTEDTYEVPGKPYFGYLRGRYTQDELKKLDDYADLFGIEMIPCIQTLAHMEKYLRWAAASDIADTDNVMMCGDQKVLDFIEECIVAASSSFRSKRIHLGMDEAQGIGCGKYMLKNGYRPMVDILKDHMAAVQDICDRHGLEPMIWSDMWMRPLSPTHEYYDFTGEAKPVTPEFAAKVPEKLNLVYWDYYHHTKEEYLEMIERHQQFHNRLVFAGGSWNWSGPVPNYGKTFDTSRLALSACREKNLREVFCTIWGDDGAESSLINCLLGLQLYAEYTYNNDPEDQVVFEGFRRCCNGCGEDMYNLRLLEELPGVPAGNPIVATPTKFILYQDVLYGLFDKHLAKQRELYGSLREWYLARRDDLNGAVKRSPKYADTYKLYAAIADLLADKAEVGLDIRAAYDAGDKKAMKKQVAVLKKLLTKYDELAFLWEKVWLSVNKPFGFDVITVRLGGTRGRIAYAVKRLTDYIDGKVEVLPELEEELLYFDGRKEDLIDGSPLLCCNNWQRVTVSCPI